MKRSAPFVLAALLTVPGCSNQTETAPKPDAANADAKKADPAPAEAEKRATEQAETPASQEEPVVASGLPIGDKFKAFQIVNCDSGDEYCQVCKYGSSPKIMAAGTLDDEAFKEDLKNIDAIVQKYGEDNVKAFAVIGESKDGKLVTPIDNRAQMQAKAKKLRAELELTIPVVIPAPKDGAANETWEQHYNVTQSRTLMFADGRNKVQYSAVAPADLGGLDAAIKQVLES
jgi:hypothetical protein